MRKPIKTLSCIILALALAFCALCVYAANYAAEDDPLISLSYVNEVLLPQIREIINQKIAGEDIGDVIITVLPETTEVPDETTDETPEETLPLGTVSTGAKYNIINLKEGQTLFASVNSCEVIVRSGQTKVISPFTVKWEEQGVSDITDGKELYNDEAIPNNHTIIIPRDDGRGVVSLAGGAWLMVRGDYKIIEPNTPKETAAIVETTIPAETTGQAE